MFIYYIRNQGNYELEMEVKNVETVISILYGILLLLVSLHFIKKDKVRIERLSNLDNDSKLTLVEMSDLSGVNKKFIKYFCSLEILTYFLANDETILFNKGETLKRLEEIQNMRKSGLKIAEIVNKFKELK